MLQQPLPLYKTADKTFEDFVVGPNQNALDTVTRWSQASGPWFVLLWGKSGVGKSHLMQAALGNYAHRGDSMMYLPMNLLLEMGADVIKELDAVKAVGIDDIDLACLNRGWETGLFALFNALHDNGGRLLVTCTTNPRFATFALPDLQSRLCSGLTYQLADLDDERKQQYLLARARRSDIELSQNVAEYIVTRHGRNLHDLSALFEKLDEAALREGRTFTVPFVKEVVEQSE